MPNWCNNHITLTHKDPAMIQRAYDALERGEFFQEFIPVPDSLKIVAGSVGDPEEQRKLEEATQRNRETLGYGNWYDYCIGEWGTKWDTGEQGNNDIHPDGLMLTAGFDTAWSPPCRAYEKLEAQGFTVSAMYYEPGMAFCGVYEDGNDDYYEIGGMKSDEVANTIPSELDDMFSIVEQMQEYELAEQEELTEWIKEGVAAREAGQTGS